MVRLAIPYNYCEQGTAAYLLPLPANLALVLLDPDIGVHALAADQLKVAEPAISLLNFQIIHHCKVIFWTPADTVFC